MTAKISMSENLKNVMLRKANWFAPECMQLKTRKTIEDIKDKVITINQVIVSNRVEKNDDGSIVMTKDGQKEIYSPQLFIAFDDDYFFTTKSRIMVEQFEGISEVPLVYYEPKDVEVEGINGMKVKIAFENQKYKKKDTGKVETHPVPVLVDAE